MKILARGVNMEQQGSCAECGAAFPADAPEGLCPQCLMRSAVEAFAQCGQEPAATDIPAGPDDSAGDAPHALLCRDAIPGYEILKEVHCGGQGIVYEAVQKVTRRRVAIKVMREGPFTGLNGRLRFDREIQILAALQHPYIVAIHESGSAFGSYYFTMDYVSGRPLDRHIREKGLDTDGILRLFIKICEGVNTAHLLGVIHRDLKPANVLVDGDGTPHILDFGLARTLSDTMSDGTRAQTISMAGDFVGSPPWASPEQAVGMPGHVIDARTDVYSLGVMLYQAVTGHFPYDVNGNVMDVLERVLYSEPSRPGIFLRGLSDEVETIILKALTKDRDRRYQSAGELGRDISHYLAGEPIAARRDSTLYVLKKLLRRHRLAVAATAAFVMLISASLVLSLSLWYRAHQNYLAAESARHTADIKTREAVASAREARRRLYGSQMLLAQQALDNNSSMLKSLLGECPVELRGWEWRRMSRVADQSVMTLAAHDWDAYSAGFSPDGRFIATTGNELLLWDAHTGASLHAHDGRCDYKSSCADFNPAGTRIVFCGHGGAGTFEVWDIPSWKPLVSLDLKPQPVCARYGRDGSRIAVGTESGRISLRDPDTGRETQALEGHKERVTSLAYSMDGKQMASSSFDGTVRIWDTAIGNTVHVLDTGDVRVFCAAFSPDGRLLASAHDDNTVRLWDTLSGVELRTLRGHTSAVHSVAFSPDGLRLCSAGRDASLRLWDVATGKALSVLRGHSHAVLSAVFSPDGKNLLSASRDDTVRLWNAEPMEEFRLITIPRGPVYEMSFSPDGKNLLVRLPDAVLVLDSASGKMEQGQNCDGFPLDFSPDHGRKLDYEEDGTPFVRDVGTGAIVQRLEKTGHEIWSAAFSPSGTQIAAPTIDGFLKIWDAGSGALSHSVKAHEGAITGTAFSRDGRQIATTGFDATLRLWDAASGEALLPPMRHPHWAMDAAFSPDGRRIVTVGIDVRIWDAENGDCLAVFGEALAQSYYGVDFSPDGNTIAACCSMDGHGPDRIKLWEADPPEGHAEQPALTVAH